MGELVKRHSVKGGIAAVFFVMLVSLLLVPASAGVASAAPTVPSVSLVPSASQTYPGGPFKVDVVLSGVAGQAAPESAQVNVSFDPAINVSSFTSSLPNSKAAYNSIENAWVATYISDANQKYDSAGKLKIGSLVCKAPNAQGTYKIVADKAVGSFAGSKEDVKFTLGSASATQIKVVQGSQHSIIKKVTGAVSDDATAVAVCAGDKTVGKPTLWPKAGDTVYFRVSSKDMAYKVDVFSVTYKDASGNLVMLNVPNGGIQRVSGNGRGGTTSTYAFEMPDSDVDLNVTWSPNKRAITKNFTPTGTKCNLMLCGPDGKESKTATMYPQVGSKVYFVSKPVSGYALQKCNVQFTDNNGKLVTLALTSEGKGLYSFKMPNFNVTLNGVFAKK